MHEHGPVGFDDQEPEGGREMGGQSADIIDAAPGDYEPHGRQL
jgi:hypothetical protein